MAIICRDYKLIFIQVPGTGCSVIGGVLRSQLGGEPLPEADVFEGTRLLVSHKHNSLPQLLEHRLIEPGDLERYTVFATVRNPFDRLVTEYQRLVGSWNDQAFERQKRKLPDEAGAQAYLARRMAKTRRRSRMARAMGFNGWLTGKLLKWRVETRWMDEQTRRDHYRRLAYPLTEGVHTLIRYERLEADLNGVLRQAGVAGGVALPHKNKTPGKAPYQSYYSAMSRRLVERALRHELALFGYTFEGAPEEDEALPG